MKPLSSELSNRLSVLSLMCAALVVSIHVPMSGRWQNCIGINAIAVPLFFTVSGLLFAPNFEKYRWYLAVLRKKCRSLFVPYCLWNILWVAMYGVFVVVGCVLGHSYGGWDNVAAHLFAPWDIFGLYLGSMPAMGVLWFVRALIVLAIVSPVFIILKKQSAGVGMIVLYFGMIVFNERFDSLNNRWIIDSWLRAFFYFGAGIWLRWHAMQLLSLRINRAVSIAIFCISAIVMALGLPYAKWYCILVGMASLWYSLRGCALPHNLTILAFPIYLIHAFVSVSIETISSFLNVSSFWSSCCGIGLRFVLMFAGSAAIAHIMMRAHPKVASVFFGGRL